MEGMGGGGGVGMGKVRLWREWGGGLGWGR